LPQPQEPGPQPWLEEEEGVFLLEAIMPRPPEMRRRMGWPVCG